MKIIFFRTQLETCSRECESSAEKVQRVDQVEKRLDELLKEKEKVDSTVNELRQRLSSLQQDLDTSEEVQKDFVRLSQSLQVIFFLKNKYCLKKHSF